jgi:type V secretory pathway adhesin AidA
MYLRIGHDNIAHCNSDLNIHAGTFSFVNLSPKKTGKNINLINVHNASAKNRTILCQGTTSKHMKQKIVIIAILG